METQKDKWSFCMERDPVFEEQVLTIQVGQRDADWRSGCRHLNSPAVPH